MKIHFDNVNFSSNTGPNAFAKRLASALYSKGHQISDANQKYDIMLSFIQQSKQHAPGSRLVQRLDGIWFKPGDFEIKNRGIKRCYNHSDLVIWQSAFDKQMALNYWDAPKKGCVIGNGIAIDKVKEITFPAIKVLRSKHEILFVCSAFWHAQKRLKNNIELFSHLRDSFYPSAGLIVLGSNPDYIVNDPAVYYTGHQPENIFREIFAASDWMIHLAWLDHCPNVVIESISQDTPVICSEQGGTKELVDQFGLILKEEKEYNFELTNYDDPPSLDVTQIQAQLPDKKDLGNHANIDICSIAELYEQKFIELL